MRGCRPGGSTDGARALQGRLLPLVPVPSPTLGAREPFFASLLIRERTLNVMSGCVLGGNSSWLLELALLSSSALQPRPIPIQPAVSPALVPHVLGQDTRAQTELSQLPEPLLPLDFILVLSWGVELCCGGNSWPGEQPAGVVGHCGPLSSAQLSTAAAHMAGVFA